MELFHLETLKYQIKRNTKQWVAINVTDEKLISKEKKKINNFDMLKRQSAEVFVCIVSIFESHLLHWHIDGMFLIP